MKSVAVLIGRQKKEPKRQDSEIEKYMFTQGSGKLLG
ncbi:uncharacterized protein CPUR_08637 [Claviceps purpurea 20.1]|uniref:Uncharacterized protein n=1 Tax=Claviceps purpurea (strain 20.1) TaxID=1111077 RepID=M1W6J8_CLAP2|nr:uncharacterized protein CPUR_08637 [Claviceps purpurea 20.1]